MKDKERLRNWQRQEESDEGDKFNVNPETEKTSVEKLMKSE